MARVVFVSGLYVGDVTPFIVPARRLAEGGHEVEFIAPAGSHQLFTDEPFNVSAYPLDCSAERMSSDPIHRRLMRHPVRNVVRISRYLCRVAFTDDLQLVADGLRAKLVDADVIVAHPTFCSVVGPLARQLGKPLVVGNIFPMLMPTRQWAPPLDKRSPSFGPTLNRLNWRFFTASSGALFYDRQFNRFRTAVGQKKRRGNSVTACLDATDNVMLMPAAYFGQPPADWPPSVSMGGFSHWPGRPGEQLDPRIDAYLNEGPPPVLVSLGSSAASAAPEQFNKIAAALADQGLRSLLLVGNDANLSSVQGHEGAFTFAPLHLVLSRCRSAVVSGSLGTLAAVLSAGLPVVVVPQLFDQVWHGGRVEQLGVGVLARRPSGVGNAIERIESDPSYATRAVELAETLNAHDGSTHLVNTIVDRLAQSTESKEQAPPSEPQRLDPNLRRDPTTR